MSKTHQSKLKEPVFVCTASANGYGFTCWDFSSALTGLSQRIQLYLLRATKLLSRQIFELTPRKVFLILKSFLVRQKLIGFQKLKMKWLSLAICLGSLTLAYGKCSTSFQFRAVCHHYLYSGSCQLGLEHLCRPIKTTFSNPMCPISICSVSFN